VTDSGIIEFMSAKRAATKKAVKKSPRKKWSRNVTEHSNALDLEQGVFKVATRKESPSLSNDRQSIAKEKKVDRISQLCRC